MTKEQIRQFILLKINQHKQHWPTLLVFLIGAILIHQGMSSYKKKLGVDDPLTEILITSHSLTQGQTLTIEDVQTQQIPEKYAPIGILKPSDLQKISGRALKRNLSPNEMILWNSLDLDHSYQSPSVRIEKGYRAVSISVDPVSSVSGMIQSGDHVDLLTTLEIPGENEPSTLTLLQNITVLQVGGAFKNEDESNSYSTVTLMVLPTEANIINHSSKYGNLSLVLRNPIDMDISRDLGIISNQDLVQAAFRNNVQSERDATANLQ